MTSDTDRVAALQASLKHRLERFGRGDSAAVLDRRAVEEASQLTALLREDDPDVRSLLLLGWLHWRRYQALPAKNGKQDLAAAHRTLVPCYFEGAEPLPEELLPALADAALPQATILLHRATQSSHQALVSFSAELWRRIAADTPTAHHDRPGRLFELAILLSARYQITGSAADLDEAIAIGKQLVDTTRSGTTEWARYQGNLAIDIHTKYKNSRELRLLNDAIEAWRAATTATSTDHQHWINRLNDLGVALSERYERTGVIDDLKEAIRIDYRVLEAIGANAPERAMHLANVAVDLRTVYKHTKAESDLDKATSAFRDAVNAMSAHDPRKPSRMSDLSILLSYSEEAADLAEAIRIGRSAANGSRPGQPGHALILSNLCQVLLRKYRRSKRSEDLEDALTTARQALSSIPLEDPQRSMVAASLSLILSSRSDLTGSITDLNEAIEAARYAATVAPPDDHWRPDNIGRADLWLRLCAELMRRHDRTVGTLNDIDEAVAAGRKAVEAAPPGHQSRADSLSNLSCALHVRYIRSARPEDLDEAIRTTMAALDLTEPSTEDYSLFLVNLAYMLRDVGRFDDAIEAAREGIQHMAPTNPHRLPGMQNLAISLTARWRRDPDRVVDLDEAIGLEREMAAGTRPDDPDLQKFLFNLGIALSERFQVTGNMKDHEDAVAAHIRVGSLPLLVSPTIRASAKSRAAGLLRGSDPEHAVALMVEAVRLLPEIAPREQDRSDKQHSLAKFSGLAATAAALVIATHEDDATCGTTALELLETGRGVLISQALETRSDLTDLAAQHPGLASRFVELRSLLDGPSNPDAGATVITERLPNQEKSRLPLGSAAYRDRPQLADEFRGLVNEIRRQRGFMSFMRPPDPHDLARNADLGPVIVINASPQRSDALIVRTSGVVTLPLPGLTSDLSERISTFRAAVRASGSADEQGRNTGQQRIFDTLEWLWDSVAAPVFGELGLLDMPCGDQLTRLWWIPGGLLGMLPVHAAGYHRETGQEPRRTVMDRVISSYTPTLRALRYARERAAAVTDSDQFRSLIVAVSEAPGTSPLLGAEKEVRLIQGRLAEVADEVIVLRNTHATSDAVLHDITRSSIVHFACHGLNDPGNPSASLLLLHDYRQNPLTIERMASMQFAEAQLAYLSACETAVSKSANLMDESIHLATTFQLLGFPQVVGTLWNINDTFAANVANEFYSKIITESGRIDTSRAAEVLRLVTLTARDRAPSAPSLWAAYLHAGA